jgi:penicillin-binding protein 2
MDVHSGELLAAASAPRFDPNLFTRGDDGSLQALLSAPGHPLFDRVSRMALPPGSVFKIVAAAALLETHAITRETPLACQGYLHEPDRLRCAVYRNSGVGHGEIKLTEALEQSCNVFFFHFAGEMGPGPLVAWAERFGAGRRTGVDLPDESPGRLGTPGSLPRIAGRAWQAGDTYGLAVGQGPLAATPLQVARWVAAIANGGTLVTPRVTRAVSDNTPKAAGAGERLPVAATTLAAIREGMERVVSNPNGTGYATVRLTWPTIAGKTGTAEVGGDQAEHAWFAGYTPADNPQWAIVVVLEHGGNGATAAGPIARRLVQALHQTDYL